MTRPRLTMLKPQIAQAPARVQMLGSAGKRRPGSSGLRWSGRKLQEWRERILLAEPYCRSCKARGFIVQAVEVDHLIPLTDGGTYDDANANPLCQDCHKEKTRQERAERAIGAPRGR